MTLSNEPSNILTVLAEKLLRSDLDPVFALQLCLAWNDSRCKPPLNRAEVVSIVNSIAGREIAKLEGK